MRNVFGKITIFSMALIFMWAKTVTAEEGTDMSAALTCNTVAAMKADTELKTGDFVRTKGYYQAEDKGGALYEITENTQEKENERTVFQLDNGLYAVFQMENNTVNVKQFGAKADGSQDDRDAIVTAVKSGAGTVVFEPGEYKCADELYFEGASNVTLEGNKAIIFTDEDYRRDLGWKEHFISFAGAGNAKKACNITIRNLTIETRGAYKQEIDPKYKNQIAFLYVEQVVVDGCKFYIPEKITADIADQNFAIKKEYSCFDLYTGWKDITVKNCQFINEAAAHYGVCAQFRDIWNAGCENLEFYDNYCYTNSKDEMIAIFSGDGPASCVKNITIRDNEMIADQVPYYERDICISAGYNLSTCCDNIQIYNNKITGVCNWAFFSMSDSLTNSAIRDNIIVCKTSNKELNAGLVRSKGKEDGREYNNVFSGNDIVIESYKGNGLGAVFSGRGYFTGNKIVSHEKINAIFTGKGYYEDNEIQADDSVSFIGKLIEHVKDNRITIKGELSAAFEFYKMVFQKKVEIIGNTVLAEGITPGTLIMLNGTMLNGYPLIFSGNTMETPNYSGKATLVYFDLQDTAPQVIYIADNQLSNYELIKQNGMTHSISGELPKEESEEKDDNGEQTEKSEKDEDKDNVNIEDTSINEVSVNEVIVPEDIKITALSIKGVSKKIAAGKKVRLTVKVYPENATNQAVTWKSGNKKYATVDSKGKVTVKKAGAGKTVTITASAKDGSGIKAYYKIKIMKHAVTKLKIKNAPKSLKAGKSKRLSCIVKTNGKKANKSLKWTSSNKKYATVNSKGKVTAKKAGKNKTVTITAMSTDGSNKKAKIKIKIK